MSNTKPLNCLQSGHKLELPGVVAIFVDDQLETLGSWPVDYIRGAYSVVLQIAWAGT